MVVVPLDLRIWFIASLFHLGRLGPARIVLPRYHPWWWCVLILFKLLTDWLKCRPSSVVVIHIQQSIICSLTLDPRFLTKKTSAWKFITKSSHFNWLEWNESNIFFIFSYTNSHFKYSIWCLCCCLWTLDCGAFLRVAIWLESRKCQSTNKGYLHLWSKYLHNPNTESVSLILCSLCYTSCGRNRSILYIKECGEERKCWETISWIYWSIKFILLENINWKVYSNK